MHLTRVVWTGNVPSSLNDRVVGEMLCAFRRQHERDQITGFLAFHRPMMACCLEAPRLVVNRLLKHLYTESWNLGVVVLSVEDLHARQFEHWNAVAPQLVGLPDDTIPAICDRHGVSVPGWPLMPASQLLTLLQEFDGTFFDPSQSRVTASPEWCASATVEDLPVDA